MSFPIDYFYPVCCKAPAVGGTHVVSMLRTTSSLGCWVGSPHRFILLSGVLGRQCRQYRKVR